ncbi:MAG: hypothetical protein GTN86_13480 [Xanthomonadales bacterium]|nr:hypothetical protein [Xanthomonadales bacterium]NIN60734.1 hypothetical protein [Xanthomonadales bacterium]NIN76096.1 hypothetical protein [Xanthomonadales bacterium]NIO15317.1 hypothetical protein [Xanthomonadales bacterium]NIP13127.1 hypothetical protein [Xanthomonadales bacterium]
MLILSVIALFIGPLLYHWLRHGGLIARAVERLVVAVLAIMVAFLLVPEALHQLGWAAVALIVAGYLVPGLLEAALKGAAQTFHLASVYVALAGLSLHALLDGAGLAGSGLHADNDLAMAIVLHRLGIGLVLWLIVQPALGARAGLLVLLLMAVMTVAGFYLSGAVLPLAGDRAVQFIQALIIGAIIHSLIHREHVHRHA